MRSAARKAEEAATRKAVALKVREAIRDAEFKLDRQAEAAKVAKLQRAAARQAALETALVKLEVPAGDVEAPAEAMPQHRGSLRLTGGGPGEAELATRVSTGQGAPPATPRT